MPDCYIAMPITPPAGDGRYGPQHFDHVLNQLFRPAIERMKPKLAPVGPAATATTVIPADIVHHLRNAELVLCDISTLNPNAIFELGVRINEGKPVVIVKDTLTGEPPFDMAFLGHHVYNKDIGYGEDLEKAVASLTHYMEETLASWKPTFGIRQDEGQKLLDAAKACGLADIYPSRAQVKQEVNDAMFAAKERLWLLGIGLYQEFNLRRGMVLPGLAAQRKNLCARTGPESDDWPPLRIMMLDPLSSIGVFRTFLECSEEQVAEIMGGARAEEFDGNPYFRRLVCSNFQNAVDLLVDRGGFEEFVRFYAHTPTCWMVIADDTAYFQPYTFGNVSENPPGNSIGHLMPVFKFVKGADNMPFEILEDHYRKLWLTTDNDLFHADAHARNRVTVLEHIFRQRFSWFEHISGVLLPSGGGDETKGSWHDRRKHPRRRCVSKVAQLIRFDLGGQRHAVQVVKTINFSLKGLRVLLPAIPLEAEDGQPPRELTEDDWRGIEEVKLEIITIEGENYIAAVFVRKRLVDACGGRFRVVYAERHAGGGWVVGMEACK